MPDILESPPAKVTLALAGLNAALGQAIPAKKDGENLLIASWNRRDFGSLTRKWTATANDSPKRDLRGLRAIIEILSRFDVIAVQEVVGALRALRDMMNYLGDDLSFLMTDVTAGDKGNNERMAFVFDRRRVQPSGQWQPKLRIRQRQASCLDPLTGHLIPEHRLRNSLACVRLRNPLSPSARKSYL